MNAEARLDHRDINRDLQVFATDPLAGAGLPLWLPDGAVIREELQALARDLARADGCQGVYSPGPRQAGALRAVRPLGQVQRRHVPADDGRRRRTRPAARELPAPRPDLRLRAAVLPGTAGPAQRARGDVPGRAVRGAVRAEPGAADQPRRHPRVLPPRPGRGRGGPRPADGAARPGDPRPAGRLRAAVAARRESRLPRHRRPVAGAEAALRDAAAAAGLAGRGLRLGTPPARPRSTGPSSTCRSATAAARRRPSRPCSSTSTSPNGSAWSTTPPTGHGSGS